MDDEGVFGFGADDFDWVIREAGEGLRGVFGRVFGDSGDRPGWSGLLTDLARMAALHR